MGLLSLVGRLLAAVGVRRAPPPKSEGGGACLRVEPLEDRANPSVILTESFESGGFDPRWTEPGTGATAEMSITSGDAHTGNHALRIRYDADEEQVLIQKSGLSFEDGAYVRFFQKYPTGVPQVGLKQTRLALSEGGIQGFVNFNIEGSGTGAVTTSAELGVESLGGSQYPPPTYTPVPLVNNRWMEVALYVKYNTPGQANGVWKLWLDGRLVEDRVNVTYRTTAQGANVVWVGGNVSRFHVGVDPAFERHLDDIFIATDWRDDPNRTGPTNRPPVLQTIGAHAVVTGQTAMIPMRASDPDGHALTWSLPPGAPAGARIEPVPGSNSTLANLIWPVPANQPEGRVEIPVTVTDAGTPRLSDTEVASIVFRKPELRIADAAVVEGNKGERLMSFTVSLSEPVTHPVYFGYSSASFTAVDGQDFSGRQGMGTIPANTTSVVITVPVLGDYRHEADETFHQKITWALNARVMDDLAVGTIRNDDPPPVRTAKAIVYRGGWWYMDNANNGGADEERVWFGGAAGDVPLTADWNADGRTDLAIVRPNPNRGGLDWLIDWDRDGMTDQVRYFGLLGDSPIVGDFDGNGLSDMAVTRKNFATGLLDWHVDTDGFGGRAERIVGYGFHTDTPVVGYFNGDRVSDFAVIRTVGSSKVAFIDTSNDGLYADYTLVVGTTAQQVVAGDFDGDGMTDFATVQRNPQTGLLRWAFDFNEDGRPDKFVEFGFPTDVILTGNV